MRVQVLTQPEGEAPQPELGRVVERGPRRADLARERGDEDQVALALLGELRAERAAPSGSGDSKLTRSARCTSSELKLSSLPVAGRAALATRPSTSPAPSTSSSAAPGSARSATIVRCRSAPPGSDCASWSSSSPLRELRTSKAPRPASSPAMARPSPPVAPLSSTLFPSRSTDFNLSDRTFVKASLIENPCSDTFFRLRRSPVPTDEEGTGGGIHLLSRPSRQGRRLGLAVALLAAALIAASSAAGQTTARRPRLRSRAPRPERHRSRRASRRSSPAARRASPPALLSRGAGDQGRQQDPPQDLHLGRRPSQLQGEGLRLLGRGQLRAACGRGCSARRWSPVSSPPGARRGRAAGSRSTRTGPTPTW